eukprot:Rmarinus@m.615
MQRNLSFHGIATLRSQLGERRIETLKSVPKINNELWQDQDHAPRRVRSATNLVSLDLDMNDDAESVDSRMSRMSSAPSSPRMAPMPTLPLTEYLFGAGAGAGSEVSDAESPGEREIQDHGFVRHQKKRSSRAITIMVFEPFIWVYFYFS